MKHIGSNKNFGEIRSLKLTIFEFFQQVNNYRTLGRGSSFFYIIITFLQLFFLIERILVFNNLEKPYSLSIFDFIKYSMRFSLLIPILELDGITLKFMYSLIFYLIYIYLLMVMGSIIYVLYCISKNKVIYFKFILDFLSSSFLHIQWELYLIMIYFLMYNLFGEKRDLLDSFMSNPAIYVINFVFTAFLVYISYLIALFNNESIMRYDNALCRKETDIEVKFYYLRTILFFIFFINAYNIKNEVCTILCIIISIVMVYLLYKQINNRYFYDDVIVRVFASLSLAYIQQVIIGLITVFSKVYITDYSLTILFCFVINYFIMDFHFSKKNIIILQKEISDLKNIDEAIMYVDILEDQMRLSQLGDPMAQSVVAGYILDHKNKCKYYNCPLRSDSLYHPLTNITIELSNERLNKGFSDEIILIHILKEIYIILKDKFYGNGKYHFAYSCFLLYRFGNIKLTMIEIENSVQYSSSTQQEYYFYILKANANERLLNNTFFLQSSHDNLCIGDILDVIVYDHIEKDLEEAMEKCARVKILFWLALKMNKVFIEDLFLKGKDYINQKNVVNKHWEKLSDISLSNKKIILMYNYFLEHICDDITNIVKGEEKKDEEPSKNQYDEDNIVNTRFYDDTGFVIIDSNLGPNIGSITYNNRRFNKMFSYSNEELLGKNINALIPESIGRFHDELVLNFIQSGKNKLIGKSSRMFAKSKDKYLKQINLMVMPVPSFNNLSEILGIIREKNSNSNFFMFNYYGVIDSFSYDLAKDYENTLDPNLIEASAIEFFIFYIFPDLLHPLDNMPLFLNEKSLYDINTLTAYIDSELISTVVDIENNNKKKNLSFKHNNKNNKTTHVIKRLSDDHYKLLNENIRFISEEMKRKLNVYKNFRKYCLQVKEYCKRLRHEKQTKKLLNHSLDFKSVNEYKLFLEETVTKEKLNRKKKDFKKTINKRQFQIAISPIKFRIFEKERTVYVMELSIPPNDINEEELEAAVTDNSSWEVSKKKDKEINEGFDDKGSVSSSQTTNNNSSIQNAVLALRDEKKENSGFNKSSYMNWLLYLILLLLFVFKICFNIFVYFNYLQQNYVTNLMVSYYDLKLRFYNLRELINTQKLKSSSLRFSDNNFYKLHEGMILNSLQTILYEKNITIKTFNITSKPYVEKIIFMDYVIDNKSFHLNDIIDSLSLNSLYISRPSNEINDTEILSLRNQLSIDFTNLSANSESIDEYQNYFIENTNEYLHEKIYEQISILANLFEENFLFIYKVLLISYNLFGGISFFIMLFIFLILRSRYNYNKQILVLLNKINEDDLEGIITQVEDFVSVLNNGGPFTPKKNNNPNIGKTQVEKSQLSEKSIERKENIFASFCRNILLILILIIIYLILVYYFSLSYINTLKMLYKYIIILCDSSIANTRILSNIRDVFINDNKLYYNNSFLFSEVLASNSLKSKLHNLNIFETYNNKSEKFNNDLNQNINTIFYTNVCNASLIDCNLLNRNFTSIYYKGFKHSISFYESRILELINVYENNKNKESLIQLYFKYNEKFLEAIIVNNYQFSEIYKKLKTLIQTEFDNSSFMFFIVVLIVSVLNTFLLLISIYINWETYIDNIKMEEYMSEKLIAEIPMSIILKTKEIGDHLLQFASNNLR